MASADGDSISELSEAYLAAQSGYVLDGQEGNESMADEQSGVDAPLREQDRFLPIANVARIMKNSVPANGKIAKDAKECVQECVSEFISFITSEASERCHQEKRKTINGEDILFAMSTLGFDNYVEPLKLYLQKYRESIKGDKSVNPTELFMEGIGDDFSGLGAMSSRILDEPGQQNVIYTTYNTGTVGGVQQLNFN